MRCPNCGNHVPEDSVFCNKCGERLGTEPFIRPIPPSENTEYDFIDVYKRQRMKSLNGCGMKRCMRRTTPLWFT